VKDKSVLSIAECLVSGNPMRQGSPKVFIGDEGRERYRTVQERRAGGLAEKQVKTCKYMLSSYCNVY
jgi:hypothetical protein